MRMLIVFFFLFACLDLFGQPTSEGLPGHYSGQKRSLDSKACEIQFTRFNKYKFQLGTINRNFGFSSGLPDLYLNQTDYLPGFFCKLEYKLEANNRLAPRFRLGSLSYTEWMEGKRELYNRYK